MNAQCRVAYRYLDLRPVQRSRVHGLPSQPAERDHSGPGPGQDASVTSSTRPATHFDLAVIGSGSGNRIVDDRFSDWRVAILEKGTFGGTCLNVGCIPTKMFVYPADLAYARRARRPARGGGARRRRAVALRSATASSAGSTRSPPNGREWRAGRPRATCGSSRGTPASSTPTRSTPGPARRSPPTRSCVATGSRTGGPRRRGHRPDVRFHTSDTIMRIDELPRRMLVLGGGFVAAEFAHVFSSFGAEVTLVNRSGRLLRAEDAEVVGSASPSWRQKRWDVRLDTEVSLVEAARGTASGPISATAPTVGGRHAAGGDRAATQLRPARPRPRGRRGRRRRPASWSTTTSAPTPTGVWALGDVSNTFQLKHVSNAEARAVQHNLLHPDDLVSARPRQHAQRRVPQPQVASVGLSRGGGRASAGVGYVVGRRRYGDTAYGWAMEDNIVRQGARRPGHRPLLGAHVIGRRPRT